MVTKNIVPGDSKTWRVARARLFATAPVGAKAEAFLRTTDGTLVKLDSKSDDYSLTITLTPSESEKLAPGRVSLVVRISADDFYRMSLVVDSLDVLPKVEAQDFDIRTEAERCLEQAEKALADYIKSGAKVKSYTIGSRSTTYNSLKELTDLVDYWRNRVYIERCAAAGLDPRTMLVEFV